MNVYAIIGLAVITIGCGLYAEKKQRQKKATRILSVGCVALGVLLICLSLYINPD